MAKKKSVSLVDRLEKTVSDMANAASVAATGSEIGVLELAAEDELGLRAVKRPRKKKAVVKKKRKTVAKKKKKSAAKKKTRPKKKLRKKKAAARRR